MESRRQAKFSRLLQREMGTIFLMDGKSMFDNQFISVVQVRVTPDLGQAKFYLRFLDEKKPEELCRIINSYTGELRKKLGNRIRNQVRKIPEISFFYDDSADYAEKMEKIFEEIKKKDNKGGQAKDDNNDDNDKN